MAMPCAARGYAELVLPGVPLRLAGPVTSSACQPISGVHSHQLCRPSCRTIPQAVICSPMCGGWDRQLGGDLGDDERAAGFDAQVDVAV